MDPIQRARDKHDLGKISFVPRRRLPELDGRDSVTVGAMRACVPPFCGQLG